LYFEFVSLHTHIIMEDRFTLNLYNSRVDLIYVNWSFNYLVSRFVENLCYITCATWIFCTE